MEINLADIKLTPDLESVCRKKISDSVYFSSEFADYISNSRLKLINPSQNGSPSTYKAGFTGETTTSLSIGSTIHELLLQPDEFTLGPDLEKPSAKLGLVVDAIKEHRMQGMSVNDSIIAACKKVHYYENNINVSRIKSIIKAGLRYYINCRDILDDSIIILSSKDRTTVENCIHNLKTSSLVNRLLAPVDLFGDPILTYNEDAFFININASYQDKTCVLKLKMKADNWTIDVENKVITLNDLKTTGHLVQQFMQPGGSMEKFHYNRQFGMYMWILLQYCKQEYGYNSDEWTVKCNVIVVETCCSNRVEVFPISKDRLSQGKKEFCRLLKMVAYCEMFGYSDDFVFQ